MIMKTNWGTFSFLGRAFFVLASIVLLIWFFCLRQLLKGRLCFHALICWEVCSIASLTERTLMKKFVSIGNLQSFGTSVPLSALTMGWNIFFSFLKVFWNFLILKWLSFEFFHFIFNFCHLNLFLHNRQSFSLPPLHVQRFFHRKVLHSRLTSREINLRRLDGFACEIFSDLNWFDRFDEREFRNQWRRTSKSAINLIFRYKSSSRAYKF